MNQRTISQFVLMVFIAVPLLVTFQNCGGHGGGSSSSQPGAGQAEGAEPVKLSGSLSAGAGGVNWEHIQMNADASLILFLADREIPGKLELYRVNRDGSQLTKVSAGGKVVNFEFVSATTPGQVVYMGEETAGRRELFAVDLDGNHRRKLSGTLVAGGHVEDFAVTPDHLGVVFSGDKDLAGTTELFASSLDHTLTPVPQKLHPALSAGHEVTNFQVIGSHVVLQGSLNTPGQDELFSVQLDGSSFQRISSAMASNLGHGVVKFESDVTGSKIVYLSDSVNPGLDELFLTDIAGGGQTKLNQAPVFGGQVEDFEITPQGQNVVYLGDLDEYGRSELYQRDIVGLTAPNKLNKTLVAGGNVTRFTLFSTMTIVASAPVLQAGVSFLADADVDDQFDLYLSPNLNQVGVRANGPLSAGGDIFQHALSPDGQRVAYIADQAHDGTFELFGGVVGSSNASNRIVTAAPGHGIVPPMAFTASGTRVIFAGDLANLHQRELWIVGFDGQAPKRLSHAKLANSGIATFKASDDGHWLVYVGNQNADATQELFITPLP